MPGFKLQVTNIALIFFFFEVFYFEVKVSYFFNTPREHGIFHQIFFVM